MKSFLAVLLCFPIVAFCQYADVSGLLYVDFRPVVVGTTDNAHFSLSKDSFSKLFRTAPAEVEGISDDFFISFTSRTSLFIVATTDDIAFELMRPVQPKLIVTVPAQRESNAKPASTEKPPVDNGDLQKKPPPIASQSSRVADKSLAGEKPNTVIDADKNTVTSVQRESSGNIDIAEKKLPAAEPLTPDRKLPRYHALIIGISTYKYAGAGIASLDRPVKDAVQLKETLVKFYHFRPEDVHLMKDGSRADIIDGLDDLGSRLTDKDNLLIFYAGHGFWDDNLQIGYWLPSDAVPAKKSTWISNSIIKDYIAGFKTKHTLLISDACFSGSIFKVREVETLSDLGTSKLYQLPSRKAMTSGNMKTVPDNSKFFEYLNKRLVQNEDLYLSARQLFHNFYVAVINNTNAVP